MPEGSAGGRQRGVLADWNDERGFGFITPSSGGARVFVHITAFPRSRRPTLGCEVTYAEVRDSRHRARASTVRYLSADRTRRRGGLGDPLAHAVAATFLAFVAALVLLGEVPGWTLGIYLLFSVLAFLIYRADKTAALRGEWRTSEITLHLIALLGGWPGALAARHVFRHKTTKQPFRTIFWATVVANCAAFGSFVFAGESVRTLLRSVLQV
ncbi:cold shock and DUF1294 domain-containing protein [Knoellia locipacati]|uniref:DUF1294 domain-containing protein n=1 Tax=Knoellia locipacati TaxID=882824 RepID=UPI003850DD40